LATEFPDLDFWHPSAIDAQVAIEQRHWWRGTRGQPHQQFGRVLRLMWACVYGNSMVSSASAGTHYDQSCVLIAGGRTACSDYSC
jgi:hypothetical protein